MKKIILTLLLLLLVGMFANGVATVVDTRDPLTKAIESIVLDEHIPTIVAIISVESGGDTLAVSCTGDYGIMQVNKRVWGRTYDFSRMQELEYGLAAGYDVYLKCLKASNGDKRLALRKYNGSWRYVSLVEGVMNEQSKS